jgi:putative ABC transport system ATP-binding protein
MMPSTVTAMIEITDVEFGWSRETAVLAIDSLRVDRGERVFVRGPSGSGKSTLLGLIGGVLQPRRGKIRVNNTDLSGGSHARRDRFRADHVGYIFQSFNLIPYLSVIDNVMLPARFSRLRMSRAIESAGSVKGDAARLLTELGIAESLHRSRAATQLSQGQQQRVAAARALLGRPEVLIADEPTSSLDADARTAFLALLLQECRSAGATLLFVSHDASLSGLFDRQISLANINSASLSDTL